MLNCIGKKKYCQQPLRRSPSPSFIKWQLPVPTHSQCNRCIWAQLNGQHCSWEHFTDWKITLKWIRLNTFWTVLSQPLICVPPYWIADKLRSSRHLLALKMEEVSAFKVLRFHSKSSDLPWFDVYFVYLMRAGSCQFVHVLAWGFEPLFFFYLRLSSRLSSCSCKTAFLPSALDFFF